MRKLIGLLIAVVLVVSLATVAFATDIQYPMEIPTSVTVAAGEKMEYTAYGMAAEALMGNSLTVTSAAAGNVGFAYGMGNAVMTEEGGVYTATVELTGNPMSGIYFSIENTTDAAAEYTLEFVGAVGTAGNPEVLTLTDNAAELEIVFDYMNNVYDYNLKYVATEAGVLTISNIKAVDPSDETNAIDSYNVQMSLDGFANYTESLNPDYTPGDTVSFLVEAGDELAIYALATDWDMAPAAVMTADVKLNTAGSQAYPIPVNAIGNYIVEGDEVWYAVNSMLAGNIIAVQGDNASIEIDGVVVNAVDGLATAVLNGDGATIAVKVSNADDMIIVAAPTEIDAAGDYTADVAAGAEVEIAVNSKLAGAILTVEGEDAYILIGTTKYDAVDGVATAVLDGEGATIAVRIGNAGDAAAQYALNIAYAPTVIAAAGDYKVNLAAGAEVEYVVNSKLDGAVVTVKGEGAYLIVDGVKVEGKDGVVTATLTAKAATIKLVVGNAGTAAAEWTVNVAAPVATNAETGDFGVIAAVVSLAVSAISGTAIIAKKKEN